MVLRYPEKIGAQTGIARTDFSVEISPTVNLI
jgi:hypothetical protein